MYPLSNITGKFLLHLWEGNVFEPGTLLSDAFTMFDRRKIKREYYEFLAKQRRYVIDELKPEIESQKRGHNLRQQMLQSPTNREVRLIGYTYWAGNLVAVAQQVRNKEYFYAIDALRLRFCQEIIGIELVESEVYIEKRPPEFIDHKYYQSHGGKHGALVFCNQSADLGFTLLNLPADRFPIGVMPDCVEWISAQYKEQDERQGLQYK